MTHEHDPSGASMTFKPLAVNPVHVIDVKKDDLCQLHARRLGHFARRARSTAFWSMTLRAALAMSSRRSSGVMLVASAFGVDGAGAANRERDEGTGGMVAMALR